MHSYGTHFYSKHQIVSLLIIYLLTIIIGLLLCYIYGEDKEFKGYQLGVESTQTKNPLMQYVTSGLPVCVEGSNVYQVKRTQSSRYFKIVLKADTQIPMGGE